MCSVNLVRTASFNRKKSLVWKPRKSKLFFFSFKESQINTHTFRGLSSKTSTHVQIDRDDTQCGLLLQPHFLTYDCWALGWHTRTLTQPPKKPEGPLWPLQPEVWKRDLCSGTEAGISCQEAPTHHTEVMVPHKKERQYITASIE